MLKSTFKKSTELYTAPLRVTAQRRKARPGTRKLLHCWRPGDAAETAQAMAARAEVNKAAVATYFV